MCFGTVFHLDTCLWHNSDRLFRRSLAIGGCVGYGCWHLYTSTVISPLIRHLENEYASLSHKEKRELAQEMNEEDSSVFIPFPFTTQKIDAVGYKATDPEWKKFGEISKDKDLQERIRSEQAFPKP